MAIKPQLLLTGSGFLALWLWGSAAGQRGESELVPGLLLAAIGLELTASKFDREMFLGPAFVAYLSAALLPEVGWGWAVFMVGVGVLARALVLAGGGFESRLGGALADGFPILLVLWAHSLWLDYSLGWAITVLLYLPLALNFPGRLGYKLRLGSVAPFVAGNALLGVFVARNLPQDPALNGGLALMLSLVLAGAFRLVAARIDAEDRGLLSLRLTNREQELGVMNQELSQLRSGLRQTVQQKKVLEQLNRLAGTQGLDATLKRLLDTAQELAPSENLAVFLSEGSELIPRAHRGRDGQRLADGSHLKTGQPVVSQAWREGRAIGRSRAWTGPRLMADEVSLAIPIGGFGVLYAGRSRGRFRREEFERLELLAGQAAVALGAAQRLESKDRTLAWVSSERRLLERWVYRLKHLLEGAQDAAGATDPSQILEGVRNTVAWLFPGQSLLVVFQDTILLGVGLDQPDLLRPVVARIQEARRLRLNRVDQAEYQSLLGVALHPQGALVVLAEQPDVFDSEHEDLLTLVATWTSDSLNRIDLQGQVLETQKMAAIGQMAAGVAHELNTPLGAAQLAVDAAADFLELAPAQVPSKLELATRSLDRARRVVSSLLYYSRRRPRERREPIDINQLVEALLEGVHGLLGPVSVECDLARDLPAVTADGGELEQVLSNLLLNARDALEALPATERRLRIRTRLTPDSLVLQVCDNGPGFSPEIAARAREPFFTTKAVGKGTGLGLSICDRIVAHIGGTLNLDRSDLGGARVEVTLPLSPPG